MVNTGNAPDVADAGGTGINVLGSSDIASVLGTGSLAEAGSSVTAPGNFDLAAAFGDTAIADVIGLSNTVDIAP